VEVEAVARHGFVDKRGRGLGGAFGLAGVVLDVLEGATLGGELGELLGEGALGRSVRRVVVFLRVPAFAKPRHHPQSHPLGQDVELRAARRGSGHETRRVRVIVFDVHAVEGARVQMHMDVEARAEPLDEGDGARVKLACLSALLRADLVVTRELLGDDDGSDAFILDGVCKSSGRGAATASAAAKYVRDGIAQPSKGSGRGVSAWLLLPEKQESVFDGVGGSKILRPPRGALAVKDAPQRQDREGHSFDLDVTDTDVLRREVVEA
jgi:hypothetical protein